MTRELILIRHGESEYNVKLTANLDSNLTSRGREQAKNAGKFLKSNFGNLSEFTALTSPYLRCLQTSKIIAEETGLNFSVVHEPREGMITYIDVTIPARNEMFPEFSWNLPCKSNHWKDNSWIFFQESNEEFLKRVKEFVGFFENKKTIVVSHGTPINSMYELSLGILRDPDIETYVDNATISYIKGNESIWFGKQCHVLSDL